MLKYILKYKNKTIFVDKNRKITCKIIQSQFSYLKKKIKTKKLVLLICKNNFESIMIYLYCLYNKNPVILLDETTKSKFLNNIITKYKPAYLYVTKKKNLINKNYRSIYSNEEFNLLALQNQINYRVNNDLAVLISTSGSTGTPKMVKLSYKNLDSNALSISKYLNITKDNISITTLSFSYSYGLSVINTHLLKGAKIILNEFSMLEKKFWERVKKNKVDSFACVPYNIELLIKINFFNKKYSSLKYLTIAGGALNLNSWKYIIQNKKKLKIFVMYGQSEASPRISYLPHQMFEKKIGSIGIPIPSGNLYIKKMKKIELANNNEIGELIYRGENVFLGYANSYKSLIKSDCQNGVLKTGDIAYVDRDGYFFLYGRIKRIAKIFGSRINLDDIERMLLLKNLKAACISNDQKLFIFIQKLKKYDYVDSTFISRLVNIPSRFIELLKIDKFPLNKNKKLDYSKLKKEIR